MGAWLVMQCGKSRFGVRRVREGYKRDWYLVG